MGQPIILYCKSKTEYHEMLISWASTTVEQLLLEWNEAKELDGEGPLMRIIH